jgi:hypothetical protein
MVEWKLNVSMTCHGVLKIAPQVFVRGFFRSLLKEIRDRGLYKVREGYQTFEAYCQGVWRMTSRHSDRLIDFHDTVVAICESGPNGPLSPDAMTEGTLRPLARLSSPNKIVAFQAAVEFAATEGRPIAARHVAMAVQDMRKATGRSSEALSDIIKPMDEQPDLPKDDGEPSQQTLLEAWDQASEQERLELLKVIRVEHHMLEEHLRIINDSYSYCVSFCLTH